MDGVSRFAALLIAILPLCGQALESSPLLEHVMVHPLTAEGDCKPAGAGFGVEGVGVDVDTQPTPERFRLAGMPMEAGNLGYAWTINAEAGSIPARLPLLHFQEALSVHPLPGSGLPVVRATVQLGTRNSASGAVVRSLGAILTVRDERQVMWNGQPNETAVPVTRPQGHVAERIRQAWRMVGVCRYGKTAQEQVSPSGSIPHGSICGASRCVKAGPAGSSPVTHPNFLRDPYRWSQMARVGAAAADYTSSWGMYELNPILGRGTFGRSQLMRGIAIEAGSLAFQEWLARRGSRKWAIIANWVAVGIHGALAVNNWRQR